MNIPQEELNTLEKNAVAVNGRLLRARDALRCGQGAQAGEALEEAQSVNWTSRRALLRLGAADSIRAASEAAGPRFEKDTPLHLLSSPANKRLYRALRDAYEAMREVEQERGEEDDVSAAMLETVLEVEQEVYGAVGSGRE